MFPLFSSLQQHTQLKDQDLLVTLQSLIDCKLLLLEEGEVCVVWVGVCVWCVCVCGWV